MTEITLLPVSETDGRRNGIPLPVSLLTHAQLLDISLKFGRQINFYLLWSHQTLSRKQISESMLWKIDMTSYLLRHSFEYYEIRQADAKRHADDWDISSEFGMQIEFVFLHECIH